MKDIFKQLILDFHEQQIPRPTPREGASLVMPKGMRKAFVLVGMRRSGKTWTLYQQIHHLLDGGLDPRKILYINFEDDRLLGVKLEDMQSLLEAYFELFPQFIGQKSIHFFFDEMHEIPGWERYIRRLLDSESNHIYITGSSAKMLSKEIATSLRGRTLVREIFPFNFREYLTHLGVSYRKPFSTKQKALLTHHTHEYLMWGGFPEVVGIDKTFHREILQGYIDTVIYRDIVERFDVKNVHVLRKLLSHCLQNPATLFSTNKMYQALKSQGYSVSKNTLYEFMGYFKDVYCLFSIPAFNFSARKSELKPRKIYPVDTGLITAYAIDRNYQAGPALESLVFASLIRSSKELYYYVTEKGQEVDFFAIFPDQSKQLIQVCLSLKSESTGKREFMALEKAMEETGLQESYLITMSTEKTVTTESGKIHIVPLLKFLI